MEQELIRGYGGKIIARIDIHPNGDKIIRDFGGRILGRYDHSADVTRDFGGRIVAHGECISILINDY